MRTHSLICGPWIPLLVVKVMSVSLYIGCSAMWFVPAEKTWMRSSFGQSDGEGGSLERVTRIVLSLYVSVKNE